MTTAAIATVLGGQRMLKRKVESDSELMRITREGLPVETLTRMAQDLAVDRKVLARVVGISDRTLSRRIAKDERLTAEESDRTVRVARVVAMAMDTFGSLVKASRWLQRENRALGEQVPLQMLDTETGGRAVEAILHRINYGIYS